MNIDNYTIEELAAEESFIEYCLNQKQESVNFWKEWIVSNSGNHKKIETARELVILFSLHLPDDEFSAERSKIIAKVNRQEHRENVIRIPANTRYNWPYFSKIAAILILGIGLGLSFQYITNINEPPVSQNIIKKNPAGQKSAILLTDGSRVILNSESSIEYSKDFNKENREIKLVGEAFFEVAKNKDKPFIVRSGNVHTTALGTSFNIKAYNDNDDNNENEKIQVSLATGKVRVETIAKEKITHSIELNSGEEIYYEQQTNDFLKRTFDAKSRLSWKEGILYFNESDFWEVIDRLEKWYGVEIRIINRSRIVLKHFSGEFKNQSLQTVLGAFAYSNNFYFKINDKEVLITF